ncbi:MAG: hypothetical protein CMI13_11795 [Oleibacter sp.]|nr:hypothetical protein [Thalassolituus sp.]
MTEMRTLQDAICSTLVRTGAVSFDILASSFDADMPEKVLRTALNGLVEDRLAHRGAGRYQIRSEYMQKYMPVEKDSELTEQLLMYSVESEVLDLSDMLKSETGKITNKAVKLQLLDSLISILPQREIKRLLKGIRADINAMGSVQHERD